MSYFIVIAHYKCVCDYPHFTDEKTEAREAE